MGKILLGDTDDCLKTKESECGMADQGIQPYLVDVTEYDMLDDIVLQDFTHNTTVATTNDENLLRVRVTSEREVGDHFLVAI